MMDVYGNAFVLESILIDLYRLISDFIINLGDQMSGRENPKKAYELKEMLQKGEILAYEILGSAEPCLASFVTQKHHATLV